MPVLDSLRRAGIAEPVGIVDLLAKRTELLKSKFGVVASGANWEEIANQTGAQAVSICLPPGPNVDVAVRALERGMHVLTEKPPARDMKGAFRLAEAACANPNLVTMVAFNRRFAPLYTKLMVHAVRLGKPHLFSGRFTRPGLGTHPSDTATDWITSDGSHALDLAIATVGFPHSIAVSRAQVGNAPDNVWAIQLHTEQGAAILALDFAAGRRVERFEVSGPGYDGVLELPDHGEWAQQALEPQVWKAKEESQTEDFKTNYGYLGEYQAFVGAVQGKLARPAIDFAYACKFMGLVEQILECKSGEMRSVPQYRLSDREGQAVEVGTPISVTAASRSAGTQPVVAIWQSPTSHARFFSQERLANLRERCELRLRGEEDLLGKNLSQTQALILGWDSPVLTADLIAQATELKLVVVIGASVRLAQPQLLLERGILLCSTSDAIAQSVAEHCLMGALVGLRRLTDIDRQMHAGRWPSGAAVTFSMRSFLKKGERLPGAAALRPILRPLIRRLMSARGRAPSTVSTVPWCDLRGQTVGLIGWGHTAKHFAQLLAPFDCQILIESEAITDEELRAIKARRAGVGEIMGAARIISLHKGMTERSRGLIGKNELALMRPGSVLINTARGPIIEEKALVARLRQGDVVAVLDVFDDEPLPARHELRRLKNVVMTPHNASTTSECYRRVGAQALDFVDEWLSGKLVPTMTSARLAHST